MGRRFSQAAGNGLRAGIRKGAAPGLGVTGTVQGSGGEPPLPWLNIIGPVMGTGKGIPDEGRVKFHSWHRLPSPIGCTLQCAYTSHLLLSEALLVLEQNAEPKLAALSSELWTWPQPYISVWTATSTPEH